MCHLAFKYFLLTSGAYAEPLIQSLGVDYSYFVNRKRVQVLSYSNHSFWFLPAVGIVNANFR